MFIVVGGWVFFNVYVFGVVIFQFIWCEVFYLRFYQMGMYIVIDWNGGNILCQQIFCLLIVFVLGCYVGGFCCIVQGFIVSRVVVLIGVFVIFGMESIEEGGGIVVVGNLCVVDGVEVMCMYGIQYCFLFLVLQFCFDVEVFFLYRVGGNGDMLV